MTSHNQPPLPSVASGELREPLLKSRGAGVIFHIRSSDQLMFFLRDDKLGISCPGMIDILGGHMEDGEEPEQAALREIAEELVDEDTGAPFQPGTITHFKTWVDERPGEHNIFTCELDEVPRLRLIEGQRLVLLTPDEARATNFAYGYNQVVNEYLDVMQEVESEEKAPITKELVKVLADILEEKDRAQLTSMDMEDALGYTFTLLLARGVDDPERYLKDAGILE